MCCDIYNELFFVCWRPAQHTNMSLSVGLHLSETYPEVTNSMLHEKKRGSRPTHSRPIDPS